MKQLALFGALFQMVLLVAAAQLPLDAPNQASEISSLESNLRSRALADDQQHQMFYQQQQQQQQQQIKPTDRPVALVRHLFTPEPKIATMTSPAPQAPYPAAALQQRAALPASRRQPEVAAPSGSTDSNNLEKPAQHQQMMGYTQPAPLYFGHNPFIEILRPLSYADDNIVTLNLSHSHIYEIDSEAFVGQRFEHIDLSNNKLGLIHSRSFRIGPMHSRHAPFHPNNSSKQQANGSILYHPTRRPPPAHPKGVTIDFSHNPAIVALSGAFDHIDVPNCLLNFTNSTVELKFGAFKKYFKEHPGHLIDIESVDCCEQEWLLGYKHNFVTKTHCDHDPNLILSKVHQQTIIDSCIAYVTSARHSMSIQGPSVIHRMGAASSRTQSNTNGEHGQQQQFTYMILGGTAMILTSLSIYIIFYMFSLKATFVHKMQTKS